MVEATSAVDLVVEKDTGTEHHWEVASVEVTVKEVKMMRVRRNESTPEHFIRKQLRLRFD